MKQPGKLSISFRWLCFGLLLVAAVCRLLSRGMLLPEAEAPAEEQDKMPLGQDDLFVLGELERRCGLDMVAAFAMYPTSIGELLDVADAGQLMPPKSTWFEPKLRSGLFIHQI